jgi:hypothetical protein
MGVKRKVALVVALLTLGVRLQPLPTAAQTEFHVRQVRQKSFAIARGGRAGVQVGPERANGLDAGTAAIVAALGAEIEKLYALPIYF